MPATKSNINESIEHLWLFLIVTPFFLILGRLGIRFDPLSRLCLRFVLTSHIAYSLFDGQPLLKQEPVLSLICNHWYYRRIPTWLFC